MSAKHIKSRSVLNLRFWDYSARIKQINSFESKNGMSLSKCFKTLNAGVSEIPSVIVGRCKKGVKRINKLECLHPVV